MLIHASVVNLAYGMGMIGLPYTTVIQITNIFMSRYSNNNIVLYIFSALCICFFPILYYIRFSVKLQSMNQVAFFISVMLQILFGFLSLLYMKEQKNSVLYSIFGCIFMIIVAYLFTYFIQKLEFVNISQKSNYSYEYNHKSYRCFYYMAFYIALIASLATMLVLMIIYFKSIPNSIFDWLLFIFITIYVLLCFLILMRLATGYTSNNILIAASIFFVFSCLGTIIWFDLIVKWLISKKSIIIIIIMIIFGLLILYTTYQLIFITKRHFKECVSIPSANLNKNDTTNSSGGL